MIELNEDHKLIQQTARDIAEDVIAPNAAYYDSHEEFPQKSFEALRDAGFLAMMVSPEYGGAGLDTISYVLAMIEVSKACASTGVMMSVNNSLAAFPLETYGSEYIKNTFLRKISEGGKLGAFALSEPDAGSDPAGGRTTAVLDGDEYILNGSKMWITNGGVADVYVVFAKTNPDLKHKGMSAFVVEKGTPGFEIGPKEKKLGIRASPTTPLSFDDCRIPKENLIGTEGEGFKIAMSTLDGGRIGIAAQALGIGQAALDAAISYSKTRRAFGQPISKFQGLRWMIADAAMDMEAAKLLTFQAAILKDKKLRFTKEAAMAKLYASEAAVRTADMSLQIHGGAGYSRDFPVERYYRDAKITAIYEGTSEIQRVVISREVIDK